MGGMRLAQMFTRQLQHSLHTHLKWVVYGDLQKDENTPFD